MSTFPDDRQSASVEALFRFQVVSEVLARVLRGEVHGDAVHAVAAVEHPGFDERPQQVSERTIYRWLEAYRERGIAGLQPASRRRTATSVVLPEHLLVFIATQKQEDIRASIPELLRRARQLGVIGTEDRIDRSTVYRACVRMGVPVVRQRRARVRDMRRFAYPHRMDLLLSDGKHFRAGATRAKRVAMFFLDDATRFGLHVVVGTSESRALFLRGLYETIQRHGLSGIIYLDHGAGFIAKDTIVVVQQLPALLIHGEKAYPEGHGKIERFHQTVFEAVLRGLDGRADVDASCGALELRLGHWLCETYNHTPHESLGLDTPSQRFFADDKPLRFPESLADLRDRFVVHLRRRVSNDHVISVEGVDFEAPRGLADTRVDVYRQVLDASIHVLHQGRLVRLHPVDLAANALARRGEAMPAEEAVRPLPKSAADLAFERDFRPVVGCDGGFPDPGENKE